MHYHFNYDVGSGKTCELQSYKLDGCKNKNFPYNSFYVHNDDYDETHIFYR